ncbi:MAG TPA: HPF/RaiA family ribosome-associated protein [Usitatibacter sp.]|nr:HPF/RaiA family ribosome-associated protein [Usitatibacter sp.]
MQLPLQVAFQGMPHSPAVDARIREHVAKLEKHHSRLSSCRVGIEPVGLHKAHGHRYAVHVELHAPDRPPIVSTRHESEDVYVAVRDAFAAVERQLGG